MQFSSGCKWPSMLGLLDRVCHGSCISWRTLAWSKNFSFMSSHVLAALANYPKAGPIVSVWFQHCRVEWRLSAAEASSGYHTCFRSSTFPRWLIKGIVAIACTGNAKGSPWVMLSSSIKCWAIHKQLGGLTLSVNKNREWMDPWHVEQPPCPFGRMDLRQHCFPLEHFEKVCARFSSCLCDGTTFGRHFCTHLSSRTRLLIFPFAQVLRRHSRQERWSLGLEARAGFVE